MLRPLNGEPVVAKTRLTCLEFGVQAVLLVFVAGAMTCGSSSLPTTCGFPSAAI